MISESIRDIIYNKERTDDEREELQEWLDDCSDEDWEEYLMIIGKNYLK